MSLIDKMRKAREIGIEADGRKFKIRRPTDEEWLDICTNKPTPLNTIRRFTIDWDMAELDLFPGGGPDKVTFDAEMFSEWIADQPDSWMPLYNGIVSAYNEYNAKREAAVKN